MRRVLHHAHEFFEVVPEAESGDCPASILSDKVGSRDQLNPSCRGDRSVLGIKSAS